jgi:hypothetical protein
MKHIQIVDGSQSFTWYDNSQNTILRSFSGFEYPATRPVIEDIPARDGSLFVTSQFGRRRLSFQGDLLNPGVFARRRDAIRPLTQGLKLLKFTTYDDLQLQTQVNIERVVMPYNHQIHTYLIEAVAPDYRFYTQALTTSQTGVTDSGGGTPVPAAVPAPVGGTTTTPLNVTNQGQVPTPAIFTIRGPGTNFVIRNTTTSHEFRLNLTLTSAESVVVDTLNRTATKGANQNVFGSFQGDWMLLYPGQNRLQFSAGVGSDAQTRLTVSFRSSYLGV